MHNPDRRWTPDKGDRLLFVCQQTALAPLTRIGGGGGGDCQETSSEGG